MRYFISYSRNPGPGFANGIYGVSGPVASEDQLRALERRIGLPGPPVTIISFVPLPDPDLQPLATTAEVRRG